MNIHLQNKIQHEIADKLWLANSPEEVEKIIKPYGPDGLIVRDMMLATGLDQVTECEEAYEYLKKFSFNSL